MKGYMTFLTEKLAMKKWSTTWVSHLMTSDQKIHANANFSGMFGPF